jgi:MoaA/NifB/PqqE/SkfB family radical SAM enzyme
MRLLTRLNRLQRGTRHVLRGFAHRHHPVLVHLVVTRRCNLACAYCNEYDRVSQPVPLPLLRSRADRLAALGTTAVTLSGGEPLMHPELDLLVAHLRAQDMFATLITNGYYLSREWIERLNRAGLDHLQISIDNVEPDLVSRKSLRLLEPKLRWLAELRNFSVSINSVLGSGVARPEDALEVARRARELGFSTTLGIAHDGQGQLRALSEREMAVYEELRCLEALRWTRVNGTFQKNLVRGLPNDWSCRAGARYLYVDENGLVHYCSQQRGRPGIPLESYRIEDIRREYDAPKGCAPYCTINCVQQVAWVDRYRAPQRTLPWRLAHGGEAPAGQRKDASLGPVATTPTAGRAGA